LSARNKPALKRRSYKDKRLKQIVRTAAGLFFKNGYTQTTTRQIAEACGISQSNLYYYIKSKDDFFDLFIELTTSTTKEYDRMISKQLPHISFSEALKMKVKEGLHLQDNIQDTILFWYRESGNMSREHLGRIIKLENESRDLLKKIIEAGCNSGEFNSKDPELAAHHIIMLEHMWSLKRWHLRKHYSLEEYIEKCQDAALGIVHAGIKKIPSQKSSPAKRKASI
jgi:TetR/AcrR family transcriptional regulator, cholesterol catabolism regulator